MASLIYINNRVSPLVLSEKFNLSFNDDFKNLGIVSSKIWYEPHYLHDRTGCSEMLWDLKTFDHHIMPQQDTTFTESFSDITDARALEIEHLHQSTNLPIVICWSGGIDSTCIVAAAYKNFSAKTRANTTILLDNCSYLENPVFFNKIIRPHFNVKSLGEYSNDLWMHNITLTGEPADPIWLHADVIEIMHRWPGAINSNLHTSPDILLEFITSKSGNAEHSRWFYHYVIDNALRAGRDLQTYEDFFWWTNFNFYFVGNCIKQYMFGLAAMDRHSSHNALALKTFLQNYQPWYCTEQYQQWSMNNTSTGVKINGTLESYKEPAKKYIFDVDSNRYYYHYKIKTGSGNFVNVDFGNKPLGYHPNLVYAVYDDGTLVRLADEQKVKSLLESNHRILSP